MSMVEETFVPEAGSHAGHHVSVGGHGIVKTGMQDGNPILQRDRVVLHCSCGAVWHFQEGSDLKAETERM